MSRAEVLSTTPRRNSSPERREAIALYNRLNCLLMRTVKLLPSQVEFKANIAEGQEIIDRLRERGLLRHLQPAQLGRLKDAEERLMQFICEADTWDATHNEA